MAVGTNSFVQLTSKVETCVYFSSYYYSKKCSFVNVKKWGATFVKPAIINLWVLNRGGGIWNSRGICTCEGPHHSFQVSWFLGKRWYLGRAFWIFGRFVTYFACKGCIRAQTTNILNHNVTYDLHLASLSRIQWNTFFLTVEVWNLIQPQRNAGMLSPWI